MGKAIILNGLSIWVEDEDVTILTSRGLETVGKAIKDIETETRHGAYPAMVNAIDSQDFAKEVLSILCKNTLPQSIPTVKTNLETDSYYARRDAFIAEAKKEMVKETETSGNTVSKMIASLWYMVERIEEKLGIRD